MPSPLLVRKNYYAAMNIYASIDLDSQGMMRKGNTGNIFFITEKTSSML